MACLDSRLACLDSRRPAGAHGVPWHSFCGRGSIPTKGPATASGGRYASIEPTFNRSLVRAPNGEPLIVDGKITVHITNLRMHVRRPGEFALQVAAVGRPPERRSRSRARLTALCPCARPAPLIRPAPFARPAPLARRAPLTRPAPLAAAR